jgi:hypothetical protein
VTANRKRRDKGSTQRTQREEHGGHREDSASLILLSILWRPFLRAVDDGCDFHSVLADPIHHHERKRWQRKFTRPFHTALSTLVGKRLQGTSILVDGLGYALSGGRVFLPDVFDNSEKVFNGGG